METDDKQKDEMSDVQGPGDEMTDKRLYDIATKLAYRAELGTVHACSSCNLTDEEREFWRGYNRAVEKLQPIIRELLGEIWHERINGR